MERRHLACIERSSRSIWRPRATCRQDGGVPFHLFVLSMHPMAAAAAAKLFKLKPSRRVLFVFRRYVVALFALGALQYNVISWHKSSLVSNKLQFVARQTKVCRTLFNYIRNRTGTDCAAAFADSKSQSFLHGDRGDQFDLHCDVVARHDHLDTRR